MYEGIQSEVLSTSIFDESIDLSTTYLGKTDMNEASKIRVEERFLIPTARIYGRKAIGQNRMSDTIGHGT